MAIKKILEKNPKLKKLLNNIISVILILTIIYALASFVYFAVSVGYMEWFASQYFTTTVIIFVLCWLSYKIISGEEIHLPDKNKKLKSQIRFSTWICPKCGAVNYNTNTCRRCNYHKK